MEKLPPAPSISRGFLEHRGPGRILPGGPPGSARPPLGICRVCPGLAAWCANWGGNLEKKMLRASHPHGAEQGRHPGRGGSSKRAWAAPQSRQRGAGILPAKIREGKRSPG